MNDFSSLKKTILVTGAGGQLGMEIQQLSDKYSSYKFIFTTKEELAIDNFSAVNFFFEQQQIDYCVNCAAYTAVDKAETEKEKAFLINADAAGNLAAICKTHQAVFIHISTDYVFDGTGSSPYKEDDKISPVNVYGASKLKGEEMVLNNNSSSIIIRTSWVYSSFGNNFVKTMLRLMKEKENINVVSDQQGCPTYAADLAEAIMKIIQKKNTDDIEQAGIYNYSNAGIISWYQFACAIKKIINSQCNVHPIPTSAYPTPAPRPHFSALDTTKIRQTFDVNIYQWEDSLHKCLAIIGKQ